MLPTEKDVQVITEHIPSRLLTAALWCIGLVSHRETSVFWVWIFLHPVLSASHNSGHRAQIFLKFSTVGGCQWKLEWLWDSHSPIKLLGSSCQRKIPILINILCSKHFNFKLIKLYSLFVHLSSGVCRIWFILCFKERSASFSKTLSQLYFKDLSQKQVQLQLISTSVQAHAKYASTEVHAQYQKI